MNNRKLAALVAFTAFGVAACGGGTAWPPSSTPATSAPTSGGLSSSPQSFSPGAVNGVTPTASLTGSGSVTLSDSASPPSGTVAIQSVSKTAPQAVRVKSASIKPLDSGNSALLYITVTATTSATITSVSATATFSGTPPPDVMLADWNGTTWQTVNSTPTVSGDTVSFPVVTTNGLTLGAGASVYLALYVGGTLTTPAPSTSPSSSPTSSASPGATATPTSVPATPTPVPTVEPTPVASPTSLTLLQTGDTTFNVTETGYTGTLTITSDTTSVVTIPISPITANGGTNTITIDAVGAGTADVTVTDSNSNSVIVPVSVTTSPVIIDGTRRHS